MAVAVIPPAMTLTHAGGPSARTPEETVAKAVIPRLPAPLMTTPA